MNLINLTAHRVTVIPSVDVLASWPPTGTVARLPESVLRRGRVTTEQGEVPTEIIAYGAAVTDLPDATPGVAYIVSRVVAAALSARPDLFFPAGEVRDAAGAIVGCRSLGTFCNEQE